jgi:hypothetical protein
MFRWLRVLEGIVALESSLPGKYTFPAGGTLLEMFAVQLEESAGE